MRHGVAPPIALCAQQSWLTWTECSATPVKLASVTGEDRPPSDIVDRRLSVWLPSVSWTTAPGLPPRQIESVNLLDPYGAQE